MIDPRAVFQLQNVLDARGYNPGPLDGVYGPKTESAVATLKANGISSDIGAFQDCLRQVGAWDHESTGYFLKLTQAAWDRVVAAAQGNPAQGSLLTTIHDATDIQVWLNPPSFGEPFGSIGFQGYGRIDTDGIGPHHGDKWAQNDTSLHVNGHALNADVDRFVVIPQQLIAMVKARVFGCLVHVTYKGVTLQAVCGDAGPKKRAGEMSRSLALDFGVSGDPNTGGINSPSVSYRFILSVARVGYALQPA